MNIQLSLHSITTAQVQVVNIEYKYKIHRVINLQNLE